MGSDARALNLKRRLIGARECHFEIISNINQTAKSFIYNCRKKLRFQRCFALSWLKDDLVNILHSIFSV